MVGAEELSIECCLRGFGGGGAGAVLGRSCLSFGEDDVEGFVMMLVIGGPFPCGIGS